MSKELCPCGSKKVFNSCCEPILLNQEIAETSLDLMRSRYVAFTKANVDYLLESHYASTRPSKDKKAIIKFAKSVKWMGLLIDQIHQGESSDEEGWVEFRALYLDNGKAQQIHENSYFKKENGRWFYVSGKHF